MPPVEPPRVTVVERPDDVPSLLRSTGLDVSRPVVVLIGGATGLADAEVDGLADYLRRHVVPLVVRVGAAVVDGGTDAGVMRAVGRARRDSGETFPLIGVVARGVLAADARTTTDRLDTSDLEPNHTHIVLVPGQAWGDEVPWLGRIASAVAQSQPSVTLLVNGGEIAYQDVAESLRRDRPVVVLAGSGRTADDVAAAADERASASAEARDLAASPLTVVVPYRDGPTLAEVLAALLSGQRVDPTTGPARITP
jgi:hypothetical protein